MTTDHPSDFINHFPPLSEEVERTLRLWACKDEIFREALIADPKGVIQYLFPQCFPDGKIPEQLTIKVIEEDPYTHHIVVPSLPDEFATPEIPEEEQLQLIANMSCQGMTLRIDSHESHESKSSEKPKHDFSRDDFNRKQAKEGTTKQENASDSTSQPPLTSKQLNKFVLQAYKEDKTFRQELSKNPKEAIQRHFSQHFPDGKVPEQLIIRVIQESPLTRHIILPSLPDEFQIPAKMDDMKNHTDPHASQRCSGACPTYNCN